MDITNWMCWSSNLSLVTSSTLNAEQNTMNGMKSQYPPERPLFLNMKTASYSALNKVHDLPSVSPENSNTPQLCLPIPGTHLISIVIHGHKAMEVIHVTTFGQFAHQFWLDDWLRPFVAWGSREAFHANSTVLKRSGKLLGEKASESWSTAVFLNLDNLKMCGLQLCAWWLGKPGS